MRHFLITICLISVLLKLLKAEEGFDEISSSVGSDIRAAHEAFLAGDLKSMSLKVRDLLKLNNLSVYEKKNILNLINRSHGVIGSSPIPTDWRIPEGIKDLTLTVQTLMDPSGTSHQLVMEGLVRKSLDLRGLKIMDAKNVTLLDTENHGSQWGLVQFNDSEWSKFTAKTDLHTALLQGLYWFKLDFHEKAFKGWFIYTESKAKSRNQLMQRSNEASVFQLSTTDGLGQRIDNQHHAILKARSKTSKETEYQVMRDAANRKILVMKRREEFATKDFIKMQSEDQSPNVLRLNHNTNQSFGDLIIRRLVATEVLIDKNKK